jgi:hypothetical protein
MKIEATATKEFYRPGGARVEAVRFTEHPRIPDWDVVYIHGADDAAVWVDRYEGGPGYGEFTVVKVGPEGKNAGVLLFLSPDQEAKLREALNAGA